MYFVNTFDVYQPLKLKVSKIESFALLLWSTVLASMFHYSLAWMDVNPLSVIKMATIQCIPLGILCENKEISDVVVVAINWPTSHVQVMHLASFPDLPTF